VQLNHNVAMSDRNGSCTIIAAIENHEIVNGLPTYVVTGQTTGVDRQAASYWTWFMSFQPEETKDGTEYRRCYFWGHEFMPAQDARQRAFRDMYERVYPPAD
jgi:hypothetical protein